MCQKKIIQTTEGPDWMIKTYGPHMVGDGFKDRINCESRCAREINYAN